MKRKIKLVLLAIAMLFLYRCSEEPVVEPQVIEEDLKTSAAAYADQFLTINITTTTDRKMRFTLTGVGGKVFVDWGDGTKQQRVLDSDYDIFQHTYSESKDYTITVSGDIKTIETFIMLDEDLKVNALHLGGLINLTTFSFQLIWDGPATLNLSQCRNLGLLELQAVPKLTDLILPTTNNIWYANLSGTTNLSTAVIDRVIARIYDAAVNHSRRGGVIDIKAFHQAGQEDSMIGPPSSYSITKLRKLRDVYQWYIYPEGGID
jgi:hypothetical protein